MSEKSSIVVVYSTHTEAEDAIRELQKSGFDLAKLSVIGKDSHTEGHVVGYYITGDRMEYWGKRAAFWGGLWGLLAGAAYFAVPGMGPILIAGPVVGSVVASLKGTIVVGGVSAIGTGLYSMGIPKDSILRYETALRVDKFLLLAQGTAQEVLRARDLVRVTRPTEVDLHFAETERRGAA